MTKIKPFSGIVYNQEKVREIAAAVCPPYDVISSQQQDYYHQKSPHNLIRVLLGKDIPGEDKYSRAAGQFQAWLKDKVLVQDSQPGIYFYSQQYKVRGQIKVRLGFIALLHLGDSGSSAFRHEYTRLGPKKDRLSLLRAVGANLSPIFVTFSDKKRIIQGAYRYLESQKPFIDLTDDERIGHRVWRLTDPAMLNKITANMQGTDIFIADGHHRYEVACAYRDEMKKKLSLADDKERFDYVLAYFTNIESPGLTILPVHRLVRLGALKFNPQEFLRRVKEYFDITEIKDKAALFFLMEKAGEREHVLGLYDGGTSWFLRLKNVRILKRVLSDKSPEYRLLDVAILNCLILKGILGIDSEDKEAFTFSPYADELIGRIDDDYSQLVFFLNPVKMRQITSIALNGERMPSKSTYFYPKVLSGLVINKL